MSYKAPLSGRIFHVEQQHSRKWEAWFDDDHSMIFDGRTKREVLEDILSHDDYILDYQI